MQNASLRAVIEMPRSTRLKLEVEKGSGVLIVDRELKVRVPSNYGFIPMTISDDGDALDVFVLSNSTPIPPMTHVNVEVHGVLVCMDGGVRDDKLIATVRGAILGPWVDQAVKDIREYLSAYKEGFEVLGYGDEEDAMQILAAAQQAHKTHGYLRT